MKRVSVAYLEPVSPLSFNPTKWSNTFNQFFTDKLHHKCLTGAFQETSQEQPGILDFHQIFDIEIFYFWLNVF